MLPVEELAFSIAQEASRVDVTFPQDIVGASELDRDLENESSEPVTSRLMKKLEISPSLTFTALADETPTSNSSTQPVAHDAGVGLFGRKVSCGPQEVDGQTTECDRRSIMSYKRTSTIQRPIDLTTSRLPILAKAHVGGYDEGRQCDRSNLKALRHRNRD